MKYLEFTFTLRPAESYVSDTLCALLADAGFDSFVTPDNPSEPLLGYAPKDAFNAKAFNDLLANFPLPDVSISYTQAEAEDRDWNAEWEQHYFQPLVVADRCVVSATFHTNVPKREYNITINPRMSFGTGHHATTSLMMENILSTPLEGLSVLDMGCGTSILGILCALKGAARVEAIDIDEWCILNSRENIELNGVASVVSVQQGDATTLTRGTFGTTPAFDLVLANIQRNVVINDLPAYAAVLRTGGKLFTSGFYEADVPAVRAAAERCGLQFINAKAKADTHWACATFKKA
ncbi:MAG: 50S ribosomal protein L11 methyltransferase [Alloprevotella sp.]|nr:50S ribosomal protein L11 methyltransferase [Alloprevotella sp.]